MAKIAAVGEILIDLTQNGVNENGIPAFSANPGGAPANLAVAAARLGAETAFIGKVGRDAFGRYLTHVLEEQQVDVRGLMTDAAPTTLAVVSVDESGERSFSFYRDRSADTLLAAHEIQDEWLKDLKFLHFGSVSLTAEPARTATLDAARRAKSFGALISYDPNYRANLWPDAETAIAQMKAPLTMVDVLKVSDEELPLLTGTDDLEQGTALLTEQGVRLILVTLGAKGAFFRLGSETGAVPGVPCKVADTNGAGDTFFGALLSRLALREGPFESITSAELIPMIAFANLAASLTTSRPGAIPAMPSQDEMK